MIFTTHHTTSQDGTVIGFRQIGSGPGLIICHGGGRISQNYEKLAMELSDTFTVYIPDRRGRGLSGPEGRDYNMEKATDDLVKVIMLTSAEYIFGHSAGALIALETMLKRPVKKLAVYEPPISINHSFPTEWLVDFEKALQENKRKRAMAISLKGLNIVEGMGRLPLWAIMALINILALFDGKKSKGMRMLDLIPTLAPDIRMLIELESRIAHYQEIPIPVCLMAGSESPDYFKFGLKALAENIEISESYIFAGCNHSTPEENGAVIANRLKIFFKTTTEID